MATARGRRKKTDFHPAPDLLNALEWLKDMGLKDGHEIEIRSMAVIWNHDGVTYFRRTDTELHCRINGIRLLTVLQAMGEQVNWIQGEASLEIETNGAIFQIATKPLEGAEAPLPVPTILARLEGERKGAIELFASVGREHADAAMLIESSLVVAAGNFFLQLYVPEFATVPAFELPMGVLERVKKIKSALLGVGFVGAQLALLFDGGIWIAVGLYSATPIPMPRVFGSWPKLPAHGLPPMFFDTLETLKKMSSDGFVRFREGWALVRQEDGRGSEMPIATTPALHGRNYVIADLLKLRPYSSSAAFGDFEGVPCYRFASGYARGVLAAVEIGSVDDGIPMRVGEGQP